jgi:hypothetical protein
METRTQILWRARGGVRRAFADGWQAVAFLAKRGDP